MNSSHGFTKAGLEKISESIRVYTYLVLTSQAAARHGILGETAPAIAAQRVFYDNLEDVIDKTVSLQTDIARYQSVLKYARSTLDYSVGKGLYMLPSDMLLKPLNQVIKGYNDKIVVNTSGFELGKHVVILKRHHRQSSIKKVRYRTHNLDDHQDEVTALIFGMVGVSLFTIWWLC